MSVRIFWAPHYEHPLPEGHRFPMAKYGLIPQQLLYEGSITDAHLIEPPPADDTVITWTHDPAYVRRLKALDITHKEERRIGFPVSQGLMEREWIITQGTILGAEHALQHGCALNVAGGTHHAYTDRGEGFCLLNDQAVTANYLLRTGRAKRPLIIDLDVHQGQGTAQIFAHEPRVFTFSMHGADNYPLHKERSDWDIALPTGTPDGPYLDQLAAALPQLLDRHRPDFLFYLAGVDPLATDKLGRLALTPQGLRTRDHLVLDAAWRAGLPLQISLGGGYSPRLADIVNAHCETFRLALGVWG